MASRETHFLICEEVFHTRLGRHHLKKGAKMTTLDYTRKVCFVCKTEDEYTIIGSTNRFGSPDLDTRPPEMIRSTIDYQVQHCPSCHYCARDISDGNADVIPIVKSDEYQRQAENSFYPRLGDAFLCEAVIEEKQGDYESAAWSAIHAAWSCDDRGSVEAAQKCRLRAIELIGQAEKNNQAIAAEDGSCDLIKIDLLRRAGEFDQALVITENTLKTDVGDFIRKILQFQKQLILQKDRDCYDLEFNKIG